MLQHVLVTGAAGAIGAATARALKARWPRVHLALLDRDATSMASLATELGDATTHGHDLRDLDGLPALVDALGPLDGLVNCAGIMRVQHAATWAWATAHDLLAIDLLAPLRLQDLVLRPMVAARHGAIVNIASMAGKVPLRGCAYYGAAKARLAMASEIARVDLAPHDVHVVTVYPGPVRSALEQGARDDYGGAGLFGRFAPVGEPDVLARKIVDAIEQRAPRVIYPLPYRFGWAAPNLARWIARFGPAPIR